MLSTYVNLFTGSRTIFVIAILGNFSFTFNTLSYLLGFYVTLRDRPKISLAVGWRCTYSRSSSYLSSPCWRQRGSFTL